MCNVPRSTCICHLPTPGEVREGNPSSQGYNHISLGPNHTRSDAHNKDSLEYLNYRANELQRRMQQRGILPHTGHVNHGISYAVPHTHILEPVTEAEYRNYKKNGDNRRAPLFRPQRVVNIKPKVHFAN